MCTDVIAGVPGCQQSVTGLLVLSHTAWSFECRPPFVRPIQRGTASFDTERAYAFYALGDWLEAEREILGLKGNA